MSGSRVSVSKCFMFCGFASVVAFFVLGPSVWRLVVAKQIENTSVHFEWHNWYADQHCNSTPPYEPQNPFNRFLQHDQHSCEQWQFVVLTCSIEAQDARRGQADQTWSRNTCLDDRQNMWLQVPGLSPHISVSRIHQLLLASIPEDSCYFLISFFLFLHIYPEL